MDENLSEFEKYLVGETGNQIENLHAFVDVLNARAERTNGATVSQHEIEQMLLTLINIRQVVNALRVRLAVKELGVPRQRVPAFGSQTGQTPNVCVN